jgi:hypothetical protein
MTLRFTRMSSILSIWLTFLLVKKLKYASPYLLLKEYRLSKPKRNDRKAEVAGISSEEATKRYKYLLERALNAVDIPDRGEYVTLHKRIKLRDKKTIDIIVYSTNTIYVSGSALMSSIEFGQIATKVIELAQQAVALPLEQVRPISVKSAQDILEFTRKLDLDKEYERMITIILSDTCNEIVLREKMKALKIGGAALDDNIYGKIKRLKDKGCPVPNEEGITNLRETRNRIVHYGEIPHRGQAEKSLAIAKSVLESV